MRPSENKGTKVEQEAILTHIYGNKIMNNMYNISNKKHELNLPLTGEFVYGLCADKFVIIKLFILHVLVYGFVYCL